MRRWMLAVLILPALVAVSCTSTDPEAQKREYVASGDRYVAQKKYPEAIIQYRNAIAVDPRFGEARYKLASVYHETGDLSAALREDVRAADLLPDDVQAQVRAGNTLILAGQFADAQTRATKALEKDPRNAQALIVLGNALAGLRDIDGAITRVEDAIEAAPHMTLAYANLGWLEAKRGQAAAAEAAFTRAVKVAPRSLAARLNLANFYWAARHRPDAEREMKAALDIDPKSPEANQLLAAFYINNGERAAGEPYLKAFANLSSNVNAKLALADFYLADGRNTEATAVLEPLRKEKDGFTPATLRVAVVHFNAGQKAQAYREVEDVLKQSPNDELALFVKTRLLIADGRFADALPIAEGVVKQNPKSVRMQYLRAAALRQLGRIDEAVGAMKVALQLMPESTVGQGFLAELYLIQRDGKGALELATQVAKAEPRSPAAHFLLGRALLETGNARAAEAEFVPLPQTAVPPAELQTWLGRTYLAQNDRAKARRAFSRAFELDPNSVTAFNGLVTLDVLEGNGADVRARLESRLAKDPHDAGLLFLAANTYTVLGDRQKGEALFQQVLKESPDNLEAYARLAAIYVSEGRLDEAGKKYQEVSQRQEKPVAALTFLGMVLELQRKPDEARKQYERALALNPRAAVAANNLAWMYADRGENLDTALQLAQTAKAVLPDNPSISNTLGWVYYKKGLFEQAVTALKESAERSPKDAAKHYYLGLAYLKANQPMEARRALEEALKLNPQFAHAEDARQALAGIKG